MSQYKSTRPLIMVSLDAISDRDIDYLLTKKNFQRLAAYGKLHRNVDSIFVSNTYSVHASISTGVLPCEHGIFDNVIDTPGKKAEIWRCHKKYLKVPSLLQRASGKGIPSCAMLYPCSPGEKVRYHISEIPGTENPMIRAGRFIRYSSLGFLIRKFFRYRKDFKAFDLQAMDTFIAHSASDLIRKQKIGLYMLHLQNTDHQKHATGIDSDITRASIDHDDMLLGILLDAIEDVERAQGNDLSSGLQHCNLLVFSDHASFNVAKALDPNVLLRERGLPATTVLFHNTNGATFLHVSPSATQEDRKKIDEVLTYLFSYEGTRRPLTEEEMRESGALALGYECGFAALRGFSFGKYKKGQHGYTLDNDDYKIFYLEAGPDLIDPSGSATQCDGGCILEVGKKAIALIEKQ